MELIRSVHMLVKSVLVLLVLLGLCSDCEARDSDLSYVTCGSLVKLLNTRHNVRLHSHDVKYGSGKLQFLTLPSGHRAALGAEGCWLCFFKYCHIGVFILGADAALKP